MGTIYPLIAGSYESGTQSAPSSLDEKIKDFGDDTPGIADDDGICETQSLLEAGDLDLDGAAVEGGEWDSGIDPGGRLIGIYSPDNLAAMTFTIYGIRHDGQDDAEQITGVNNSTVESTYFFKKVTRIECDDACTNVKVGFGDAIFLCDIREARHFRIDPANNADVWVAMGGESVTPKLERATVRIERPAAGDFTWLEGAKAHHAIYFDGGAEITPTAGGTDIFEMLCDGTEYAPGYKVWYCVGATQDIKA